MEAAKWQPASEASCQVSTPQMVALPGSRQALFRRGFWWGRGLWPGPGGREAQPTPAHRPASVSPQVPGYKQPRRRWAQLLQRLPEAERVLTPCSKSAQTRPLRLASPVAPASPVSSAVLGALRGVGMGRNVAAGKPVWPRQRQMT